MVLAPSVLASDLPPDEEALILTRALAYDRNLRARAGDELTLAVLVRAGDSQSLAKAQRVHASFRGLEKHTVQGLPFRAVLVEYSNPTQFKNVVTQYDIDVVYIADGMSQALSTITALARAQKFSTLGAEVDYVREGGLCLAVTVYENQPRILLNRAAAEQEGASFGAGLLRLAKMVN